MMTEVNMILPLDHPSSIIASVYRNILHDILSQIIISSKNTDELQKPKNEY